VRLRGPVAVAPAEEASADLHARSTGALAAALTGRQSAELGSADELARASEAAWERAGREPDAPVPSWTLYRLRPDEVEFFQGEARRRHVRLVYRRTGGGDWDRRLLWP
jgi:pyridoxamine 5'-phosphate oxidase